MMNARGINKSTTAKTTAPRLQVEDPFDKSFRPESGEQSHREKSGPKSNVTNLETWEIDLAAFNEVELDSLLSAMSDNQSSRLQSVVGHVPATNVDTDQRSMVSVDANEDDEHSWVMGTPIKDEEVDWEVISNSDDSVISLVSNVMIPWTYRDALTLGKGSSAMDQGDPCSNESCPNLRPPIVDIQLRSSSKYHPTPGTNEEFDADFFREGVKSARGGRTARMFKGNYPPSKKKPIKAVGEGAAAVS
jgi:hypothetical protein